MDRLLFPLDLAVPRLRARCPGCGRYIAMRSDASFYAHKE